MKFLICVFFVCTVLNLADCDSTVPKHPAQRLRETLLCGYDKTDRPALAQLNQTQVYVIFIPRYIAFDDSKDFMQLSTFIYMSWHDYNLQWLASDYDNITSTTLEADDIWIPDFRISNSKLINRNFTSQGGTLMMAENNGIVHYVMPTLLGVHCSADWTNWPFDKHVCNFSITSERHMGSELDVFNGNIVIRMFKYIHSHEWELLKYESLRSVKYSGDKNDSEAEYEVFMTLRFTIQRHSAVLAASYISPAVALVVFSLGLLLIEPTNFDRLTIISLMLTLQCLYLQYLAYKIPSNGDKTPKIVKFFASNLFLTGVLLIETMIAGSMPTWTSKPTLIQSITNMVSTKKLLKLILLPQNDSKKLYSPADPGNEEDLVLVSNDGTGQQWKIFAKIVNRLTFFLLLIFYVIVIILCFAL